MEVRKTFVTFIKRVTDKLEAPTFHYLSHCRT